MKSRILNLKWVGLLAILLAAQSTHAFPPAPHHLFIGTVRDELGNPLSGSDVEIIFETASGRTLRTRAIGRLADGSNYRLAVPMDAGLTAEAYKPTAMRPTLPFTISVKIGTLTYLPIELVGKFGQMGAPGKTTHLDLTLGVDSDGDGLPDAWEQALIDALADLNNLGDVNPNDDSDGDGLSNLSEYISGNFAFDSEDGFSLKVLRVDGDRPLLEFLAIRNRNYSVMGSADLKTWQPVSFQIPAEATEEAEAPMRSGYRVDDVHAVQLSARQPDEGPQLRFFKLQVQ
ncbi:MAG: hypothetical protein ACI9VS_001516 [Candidatus Binatia bacterium]|jgi:hypothetical protein